VLMRLTGRKRLLMQVKEVNTGTGSRNKKSPTLPAIRTGK
jgi:hypothetical protein